MQHKAFCRNAQLHAALEKSVFHKNEFHHIAAIGLHICGLLLSKNTVFAPVDNLKIAAENRLSSLGIKVLGCFLARKGKPDAVAHTHAGLLHLIHFQIALGKIGIGAAVFFTDCSKQLMKIEPVFLIGYNRIDIKKTRAPQLALLLYLLEYRRQHGHQRV